MRNFFIVLRKFLNFFLRFVHSLFAQFINLVKASNNGLMKNLSAIPVNIPAIIGSNEDSSLTCSGSPILSLAATNGAISDVVLNLIAENVLIRLSTLLYRSTLYFSKSTLIPNALENEANGKAPVSVSLTIRFAAILYL